MGFDMNYKIKVESNVEEIQDLFIQLGCTYFNHTVSDKNYMLIEDGKAFFYKFKKSFDKSKSKEITLPELRDLVVLKRSDIEDATHENIVTGSKVLQLGGKNYYWQDGKWNEYPCGVDIKPIEKKEMKEYLEKQPNGSYVMKSGFAFKDAGWIEIPEWALYAYDTGSTGVLFTENERINYAGFLVWQRESLNDKLASAEQYRQAEVLPFIDDAIHKSREWDLSDYDFAESDAWIESNVEQGSIEQTLAQRQSQYGCFEDVAFVTQGMIELMRKCNYDKMPASHQMALSMIASKMARIVNGDFNHKDSWHDIGGYAKLVENEIFDETEMPF